MKYNYEKVNIDSNIAFMDSANFEIGDHHKLLELAFKDLYNFKIRTCVQEYVSNAIDAHLVENKTFEDIIIEAPKANSLFFKVRDHGKGLSHNELKEFIRAGISGSSDFEETIGGFGFGSKIGFAVSNIFYVISRNNGIKYTCEATRKTDDGSYAKLNFISKEKTNEKSGLEIIIPVQRNDIDLWYEGIQRMYRHMETKPSLRNIKINKENYILEDTDYKYFNNDKKNIFIILGSVEYPLDHLDVKKEVLDLFPKVELGIKFPVSAFKPQRNREFLQSTPKVNKLILEKAKAVRKKIEEMYLDKLSSFKYEKLKDELYKNPFFKTYNKKIKNLTLSISHRGIFTIKRGTRYLEYFYGYNYHNGKSTSFAKSRFSNYKHFTNNIIVDNTPEEKERIKKFKIYQNFNNKVNWITDKSSDTYEVWNTILISSKLKEDEIKLLKQFIGSENIKKISELKYVKPETIKKEYNKERFSCTYSNKYHSQQYSDLDIKKTFYITREEWFDIFRRGNIRNDIDRYAKDNNHTYFVLSKNVVPKFKKLKIKQLTFNNLKNYFLTKYKDNTYKFALLDLYDVSAKLGRDTHLSFDFEELYKVKDLFPIKLLKYLKDYKKVHKNSNSIYEHSFTNSLSESNKKRMEIEKEFSNFIKKNPLIFELLYSDQSLILKYKKRNNPIIKKLFNSVKK